MFASARGLLEAAEGLFVRQVRLIEKYPVGLSYAPSHFAGSYPCAGVDHRSPVDHERHIHKFGNARLMFVRVDFDRFYGSYGGAGKRARVICNSIPEIYTSAHGIWTVAPLPEEPISCSTNAVRLTNGQILYAENDRRYVLDRYSSALAGPAQ
jgi:hypothetical protein